MIVTVLAAIGAASIVAGAFIGAMLAWYRWHRVIVWWFRPGINPAPRHTVGAYLFWSRTQYLNGGAVVHESWRPRWTRYLGDHDPVELPPPGAVIER